MKKMKKRVMALLVVFTSIISFFPAEFIGQAANAATTSTATAIQVSVDGSSTPITPTTDTSGSNPETIYADTGTTGAYDITVQDLTEPDLVKQVETNKATQTGIIAQSVQILSINDISCTTTAGQAALADLGITISSAPNLASSTIPRIGEAIKGLPLGINKISYQVVVTTQTVDYTTTTTTDANGNTTITGVATPEAPVVTTYDGGTITICSGTSYTTNKIKSMLFKAYTGTASYFNSDDTVNDTTANENNALPFLYNTTVNADSGVPLRYTFDVPDSTSALKYVMTFDSGINLSNSTVYKNGTELTEGIDYQINGSAISGDLERLTDSELIMVKINSTANSSTSTVNISKVYAIEIRYNTVDSNKDYSMYNAGITKGEYADDDSVKAYIGKVFNVTKDSTNSYNIYTGNVYISQKAGTVSIDPTLYVDNGKAASDRTMAYTVENHYTDSSGANKIAPSILSNGKQYVNFDAGSNNIIYVTVYNNGNGGSLTSSSVIVARYILNVNIDTNQSQFNMGLAFDGDSSTDSTYLTQPGVTKADNGEVSFNTSRRTYDLYTTDSNKVKVTLSGQTSNNEYLKIWLAKGTQSNALYNATVSESGDDYDVTLDSGAKKMVVQAYYNSTTGAAASYAVGDTYVFYLPEHYDSSDTSPGDGGSSSADASLSDLEVKGITLKDSDGNSGFSSTEYDYTVTVDKGATTAKISATATDSNVKSIVATVKDTNESDTLTSGEENEIALDTDGKTTVNIVVTAQDGITTRTYTLIIQNNTKSNNADLENVILNTGDYKFDPAESTTTVRVSQDTTSITVTPVPKDSNATVTVNGDEAADGPVTVNLRGSQKTEIEIVVTSQDGTETKTYTLEVYRTDSTSWQGSGDDSSYDDQYYDEYYNCWVDTTKYDEWGTVNGKPVYFDKNHRQVKDAWITTGGKYYYLNSSGYRSSGWKVDSATGQSYYLDPTTGEMKLGWINLNNTWYYLGLNGVMHKGWLYLNGKWYYFTPNGQMVVNQTMFVDDKNYTFGQDGTVTA
ncbi:cadherin-like beta sandwich domain-containing protein [Clostridium sp. BL-8]|uniref:cadherin-like beta sandwich domain-containing protein n=1 Tax=Clostridium sp. BL-8 TaxID=349938 RepID=UPI00098C3E71|nr:cadherin-like beta sandwich domain-containing protein [Clostridium sp. BL-8]OOM74549.1 toxin A [Clostridium sp. BL-8]